MAFPCVGAKSALARGGLVIHRASDLTSAWDDLQIYAALMAFVARYRTDPAPFQSLSIVFEGPGTLDEAAFETALWQRAQSLSDKISGWARRRIHGPASIRSIRSSP
ncbi:YqcI/YcgG family protein [Brevundimonas sp. SL161]|uniref:YqcI/YcgG family protein n=1 Tax=Brevundimonas sp. SL161 TaxID=2804613 RepID=UPI003CF5C5C6